MPYDYYYPTTVSFKGLHDGVYLFEVDGPKRVTIGVTKVVKGYATFVRPESCSFGVFLGIVDGCLTEGSNFPMEFRKAFPDDILEGAEYELGSKTARMARLS